MKKIMLLITAITLAFTFASCTTDSNKYEPISIAKMLEKNDYCSRIFFEEEHIKNFSEGFDTLKKGVSCIIYAITDEFDSEKSGFFVFCDDVETTKKMTRDLEYYIEVMNRDSYYYFKRGVVKRHNKIVFIGYEAFWDAIEE